MSGQAPPPYPARPDYVHKEVKLSATRQDREKYDTLADLFAIIKSIELLEKAYLRDAISAEEYTPLCEDLLRKCTNMLKIAKSWVPSISAFMAEYQMECRAAEHRISEGVPSTFNSSTVVNVADTVGYFITSMDSIKLGMVAVDQLQPNLNDLLSAINRVPNLSESFGGKLKLKKWLETLSSMNAHDELDENQTRQLLFDLDSSFTAFQAAMGK